MTSRVNSLLILALCAAIAGCARDEADDYCRDHFLVHSEHRLQTGTFFVLVGDDGLLESELVQPVSLFTGDNAQDFVDALQNADNVYTAGTSGQCSNISTTVRVRESTIVAEYAARCDSEQALKIVDVKILDLADEINEIVVTVATPATAKRFAINRQCSAPIFRIEKPGEAFE